MNAGSLVPWLVVCLYLASSAWLTLNMLRRWCEGQPWLPWTRAATVPWQLIDLVLIVFGYVSLHVWNTLLQQVLLGLPSGVSAAELSPAQRALFLSSSSLTTLIAVAGAISWLIVVRRARWPDLGWATGSGLQDLKLGVTGFLLITPWVYALQFLVTRWFPSAHPLIELLRRDPDPWFFVLSGFMAVVVAPVAEEFFFRVLLQGWVESMVVARGPWFFLAPQPIWEQPAATPPTSSLPHAEATPVTDPTNSLATAVIPVLISSATFALAHYRHGPDPIPLFVLALVLGWIYRHTRRLLPCIVIHALLNFCSLLMLLVYVYGP